MEKLARKLCTESCTYSNHSFCHFKGVFGGVQADECGSLRDFWGWFFFGVIIISNASTLSVAPILIVAIKVATTKHIINIKACFSQIFASRAELRSSYTGFTGLD